MSVFREGKACIMLQVCSGVFIPFLSLHILFFKMYRRVSFDVMIGPAVFEEETIYHISLAPTKLWKTFGKSLFYRLPLGLQGIIFKSLLRNHCV